jgi:lipopolysaccharide assembly protein A
MRLVKTILLVLLIASIALFTFQNMELVQLNFLNASLDVPLSLASVSIYILGGISGGLVYSLFKKLTLDDTNTKSK